MSNDCIEMPQDFTHVKKKINVLKLKAEKKSTQAFFFRCILILARMNCSLTRLASSIAKFAALKNRKEKPKRKNK